MTTVTNGAQVGSGYDVQIKRESATSALVNVMTPNGDSDWLMAIDVEPATNLQALAREIGNCPDFGNNTYVTPEDDAWHALATRWEEI